MKEVLKLLPTPPDGTPLANINIQYNLLNLPQTAVTATGGTDTYTYDANGQKLRKVNVNGANTVITDYISGIQYKNNSTAIDFIQTEEGKAVPQTSGGYDYYYYLGDNLGNTRVTFDTQNGVAAMLQQDDYYRFGMEISRGTVTSPKNYYLYNKKELQEELQQYDYGARFYDPVIARWNTIDPLAELNRRWTTYNYGNDNPIRFIDPNGRSTEDWLKANGLTQDDLTTVYQAPPDPPQQDPNQDGGGVDSNQCCVTAKDHTANVKPKINLKAKDDPITESETGTHSQDINLSMGTGADAANTLIKANAGAVIYYSNVNGVLHWVATTKVIEALESVSKAGVVAGILIDGTLYITGHQSGAKTATNLAVSAIVLVVGGSGGIFIALGYFALDKAGLLEPRKGTYNIDPGTNPIDALKYIPFNPIVPVPDPPKINKSN